MDYTVGKLVGIKFGNSLLQSFGKEVWQMDRSSQQSNK